VVQSLLSNSALPKGVEKQYPTLSNIAFRENQRSAQGSSMSASAGDDAPFANAMPMKYFTNTLF
jgi:hypothetical protein